MYAKPSDQTGFVFDDVFVCPLKAAPVMYYIADLAAYAFADHVKNNIFALFSIVAVAGMDAPVCFGRDFELLKLVALRVAVTVAEIIVFKLFTGRAFRVYFVLDFIALCNKAF